MYIRTHTHTQARTHTTKFSGQHVVHFFTLSLFFFSSSLSAPFGVSTRRNYLVRLFFTALVVQEKQTRTSRTIVTSQHRCTRIRSASPSRDKHSVSFNSGWIDAHPLRSEPTLFFFLSRGPKVWSMATRRLGHLRRLSPQNSTACMLLYHTSVPALYILLKKRTTARTTSENAHTHWMKRTMETISYTQRRHGQCENAYANAAVEETTHLERVPTFDL